MSAAGPQVYVWRPEQVPAFLAARSVRWLEKNDLGGAAVVGDLALASIASNYAGRGILVVRAGVWGHALQRVSLPLPSAAGKGLCAVAVGSGRESADVAETRWSEVLASTGGVVTDFTDGRARLDLPAVVYLDPAACGEMFATPHGASADLWSAVRAHVTQLRIVAWPGLEIFSDPRLRVLQAVTSLQRGGAERIALNLAALLAERGIYSRIAAPFQPTRASFARPPEWLDLERARRAGEASIDTLVRLAGSFDLLHLHLFKPPEIARFVATGVPAVLTVHNSRAGWPAGFAETAGSGLALVAACSLEVEAELRAAGVVAPLRTVWNGIDFDAFRLTEKHGETRRRQRREWGFGDDDWVLLAIANPRSQKRQHMLPAVLAAVQMELARRGMRRRARLVFVGQPSEKIPDAQTAAALVRAEVARHCLDESVKWIGGIDDIPGLLAAGDVLVSASAHEGLSLVHLEALAMQRPVVCTATAGTREVAHGNPAMRVLPLQVTAEDFAAAVVETLSAAPAGETTRASARRHFDFRRMAERYHACYLRCVAQPARPPSGVWLITNNFSMGGAQTSARRLLTAFAECGLRVRAATVQEEPASPTKGTVALRSAGVPVRAFGPHGAQAPEMLAAEILAALDDDPPEAVLFWNLIPVYKLLLADGCRGPRVFDISPGEMFFHSLENYFEKRHRGLPYLDAADYGQRLAGVVVKYRAEAGIAAGLGAPVWVIPNGVPLPPLRAPRRASSPVLVFGTATRINPQKRLEDVIAALQAARARLPAFEFRIAGRVEPGCEDYHAALRALAGDLPVTWLGELPHTMDFLPDLDLFLMSSEPAGCPNALLEALAVGLPTIATDVGGAGDQVIDGVTGRLVPARDVPAMAEAIAELAMHAETRETMGRNARRHIEVHFSMEKMASSYRRVCLSDREKNDGAVGGRGARL